MGHGTRRWAAGLGTAAAAAASVLGQAGVAASAAPAASARPAAPAASAGPAASASSLAHSWQVGRTVVAGQAAASGSVYLPAGRILGFGDRGPAVRALQRRLSFLHYYPGKIDGHFGWDTMEAVWAFKEVQSGRRIPPKHNIVGAAMQRQLQHPKLPKVLHPRGGSNLRIEINKKIEVLVLYHHNKVELISHVSTAAYCRPDGCGWVTPNGFHRALWFAAGWVGGPLGSMYNPVVFTPDGAYAIHGEPNPPATISFDGVPLNPASHGCVRIPFDLSKFFHKLIRPSTNGHGTPIWIWGPNR